MKQAEDNKTIDMWETKVKTAELTGAALDWAVAKCEGVEIIVRQENWDWYSSSWEQGGPIIERECIELAAYDAETSQPKNPEYWEATIYQRNGPVRAEGTTPLVAAMRCYVASKLGDFIEIPEDLK